MKYREDRYGNRISQLGLGCMRFARKGGGIDFDTAEKQILMAMERGINYFDTAYIYPGSEECLGKILEKNNCREKVYVATKLPQYLAGSIKYVEKTFKVQLNRLRTDYIDYYLMHMFTDVAEWKRLRNLGIEEWISDAKATGRIRQIGFSFHGDSSMFLKILEAYDWDFCMIQYNYLDEHSQAGRIGLEAAAKKGIPVMIMEPLRGGKLVNLPEEAMKLLSAEGVEYSPAELGLRWLWNQKEVTCVLSGMNSEEMIEENVRIASEAEAGHMDDSAAQDGSVLSTIEKIRSIIKQKEKVGCTGCQYCLPCPKGVDIPGYFYYYNLTEIDSKKGARFEFARNLGMRKEPAFASQCVGCRACEKHCPQSIEISRVICEADRVLRPLPYRLGINIARKIMK